MTAAHFHNTDNTKFGPNEYKVNNIAFVSPLDNIDTAHAYMTKNYNDIPMVITATTLPPQTTAHALLYPDANQWMESIDNELDKIDARGSVDWSATNLEKRHRPIPFTVKFV